MKDTAISRPVIPINTLNGISVVIATIILLANREARKPDSIFISLHQGILIL